MGFMGSARGLTPNLDTLAKQSIVFTRAYAQAPITTVSHATLLTGTFPPFHRVNSFGSALPPSVPYLPQIFHDAGYRTGAFVGSLILDPRLGTAPGFDRGFDTYDAGFHLRRPAEPRYGSVERRADEVVDHALVWLTSGKSQVAGQSPVPSTQPPAPFFLWAHLFDAHDPYDPPADLRAKFASAPYDGEIAAMDRASGRLVQAAGPDTIVVVAADHGEALGDHGEDTHGVFLYDATLHVPLMIRLPAAKAARVTTRVRLADVAPTLLEAVGLAVPRSMQGEPLAPLARLKPGPTNETNDRPVYAETDYTRQAFGWSPLAAWRADRFLLIRAPKPELYDIVSDPPATKNLAGARARVVDGMSAELRDFITRAGGAGTAGGAGRAENTERTKVDAEVARRLASLGYTGGSGAPVNTGIDPKDRIAIANDLHRATVLVEDGAFARAIPLLERVTASEPNIPLAQLQLGAARARGRQFSPAVAPLKKAVSLDPENAMAHYELGVALFETGDLKGSAAQFEAASSTMRGSADVRYSLGSVYARIDRIPDALTELRAALDLEPRHFRANLLMGRILTLQNRIDAALPYLRTAVDIDPANAEAKAFLDEALKKR